MTPIRYAVGIDLGQASDYTTVVVLEYDQIDQPVYRIRYAYRFPLGTSYPDVAARIAKRITSEPLNGRTIVAIDATGVGPPVVDILRALLPGVQLYPITITGGTSVGGKGHTLTIPKRDLISTTQVLLQQQRVRIAPHTPDTTTLIDELLAYRATISDSGHDSYGARYERDHDDLVTAFALAAWTAENKKLARWSTHVPRGRIRLGSWEDDLLAARLGARYYPPRP